MSVLTLAKAKTHLNIGTSAHDVELQDIIDAAEAAIAEKCGPLEPVAKSERVVGCGSSLLLRHTPVVELTSVTPVGGTAYDVALFYVDPTAGVVTWASGRGTFASSPGYDVVYQAGRSSVPADLLLGVKEHVRHLWESQRGPQRRPGSTTSDAASNTLPGAAYLFPFRVEQLLAPHRHDVG